METTEKTKDELIIEIDSLIKELYDKHDTRLLYKVYNQKKSKQFNYDKLEEWLKLQFPEVYERKRIPELVCKRGGLLFMIYEKRGEYINVSFKKLAKIFNMNHSTLIYLFKRIKSWKEVPGYEKEIMFAKELTDEFKLLFSTGYFDIKI